MKKYFLFQFQENTIKIFKFHFLNKICEIQKNVEIEKVFA